MTRIMPESTNWGKTGRILLVIGLVIVIANIVSLSLNQGFCCSMPPDPILTTLYIPGLLAAALGAGMLLIESIIMRAKIG